MEVKRIGIGELDIVHHIVKVTIDHVYPKFYTKDVVKFFKDYHSFDNVLKAITKEKVFLVYDDGVLIATVSYDQHHLKRMFVLPEHQHVGYGKKILKHIEGLMFADGYNYVTLDASLPGYLMYIRHGYDLIETKQHITKCGDVLIYMVMEKKLQNPDFKINYHQKKFVTVMNSESGEVSNKTVFTYYQQNELFWGSYEGGQIIKGSMVGTVTKVGHLKFNYQHINKDLKIRTGICDSIPMINEDGLIILHEKWQWTNGDCSSGSSKLIEIK